MRDGAADANSAATGSEGDHVIECLKKAATHPASRGFSLIQFSIGRFLTPRPQQVLRPRRQRRQRHPRVPDLPFW